MRIHQQQAIRAAVGSVLLAVGLGIGGCDALQGQSAGADQSAMQQVGKGDYQAAASEQGTSPAVAALAAGLAADQQRSQSVPQYRKLTQNQIALADTLSQLNRLSDEAQHLAEISAALSRRNPSVALSRIESSVEQVKGVGSAQWTPSTVPDPAIALPTVAAASARANALKDKIGEIERNLAKLQQERTQTQQSMQTLMDESRAAQGRQSVDLFTQAVETRKQSEVVVNEIERVEASLVPLRQDLAVAEQLVLAGNQTVEVLGDQRETVEKSWRGVTAQADELMKAASRVYGGEDALYGSVLLKSRELNDLLRDRESIAGSYEQQMQGVSRSAKAAVKNAGDAVRALNQSAQASVPRGGVNPQKALGAAIDQGGAQFVEANTAYAMGDYELAQTGLYDGQARVAEKLAQTAQRLNQKSPEGMDATNLAALKQQWGTRAGETLKAASEQFDTISQATMASKPTQKAAKVARVYALHASAMVASTLGDAAAAKESLDEARALRDRLSEEGTQLPSVLPELQSAGPSTAPSAGVEAPRQVR